jgi:hypothetical protein
MVRRTKRRDPELERFWRRSIAERERSGLSVREHCVRRGVKEAHFYAWRREIAKRDRAAAVTFVPLRVRAEAIIEVVLPSGVIIRVPIGVEATSVAPLVAALRAASC